MEIASVAKQMGLRLYLESNLKTRRKKERKKVHF